MNEVFALLLIALVSRTAFAINCYSCESTFEPNCGEDNFEAENYYKMDCLEVVPPRFLEDGLESFNSTACMKKVYVENGEWRVVRSCFFGDENSTMSSCSRDPTLDPVEEISCDVCDDKSYCNGANEQIEVLIKSYVGVLALIVVARFINF